MPSHWRSVAVWPRREACDGDSRGIAAVYSASDAIIGHSLSEVASELEANADWTLRSYSAFGAGDLQGLLGVIDRDVDWAVPGSAPWSGEGRGHDHVKRFFQTFGTNDTNTTATDVRKGPA